MSTKSLRNMDFDSRWLGPHGIGRFAAEVRQRIAFAGEVDCRISPSHPLDALVLSTRMAVRRRSMVYSPGFNAPILGLDRYVLTVHDLNHIDIPGQSLLKRLYYRVVLKRACRRAAKVLTVSEFSRCRIIEWAQVPESQVVNVGNGVGTAFTQHGPVFNPGYRYFLCVSNRKAHKNEERMLSAFALAEVDHAIKLLVSGESTAELRALVGRLGVADRVEFTGWLSDGELAARYRGAVGLLFASLYEGFGLPIVEAMSCGTPVITSNVTAMPEVAGDAAILVDPLSVSEISSAISKTATNSGGVAAKLRQLGLARAGAFDWDRVAARVFVELESVARQE
ncbi:MAG: glycosyltransferase involved in cell wall biosynthesis [Paracoccaceae bacterium]|jgi:glycosyltransferase involved in cell wall biosynthesis